MTRLDRPGAKPRPAGDFAQAQRRGHILRGALRNFERRGDHRRRDERARQREFRQGREAGVAPAIAAAPFERGFGEGEAIMFLKALAGGGGDRLEIGVDAAGQRSGAAFLARNRAQANIEGGEVSARFAAMAQEIGDELRAEPVPMFERGDGAPGFESDRGGESRGQGIGRLDFAAPPGKTRLFVEFLVIDQGAAGVRLGIRVHTVA